MKKAVRILTILALVLTMVFAVSVLSGCNDTTPDSKETEESTTRLETTAEETTQQETETEELKACEHSWTEIGRYQPTCSNKGSVNYKCTLCHEQRSETLDKIAHTVVTVAGVAPTCEKSGYSDSEECSVCGCVIREAQYLAPTGPHTPETVYGYPATCTADGLTDGVKCSTCGEFIWDQQVIKATHTWLIIDQIDPTCTTEGRTGNKECQVCHELYAEYEVIPATHTGIITLEGYEANCTESGLTDGEYCTACGETVVAQQIIDPLSHDYQPISGYAATCSSNGLSDGSKCSRCYEINVPQEVLFTSGHVFVNGECTGCDLVVTTGLRFIRNVASTYSLRSADTYLVAGFEDGYGDDVTVLVIPETTPDGAPVVGIAEGAFEGNTTIEMVVLPETIVSVGINAFEGCTALQKVECKDFAQTLTWDTSWNGSTELKVTAVANNGKNPYEIYLEAMRNTGHNYDRYIIESETYTYGSINGIIHYNDPMSHTYTKQMQCVQNCYVYQRAIDYSSGQTVADEVEMWYVGGYIYMPNFNGGTNNIKMQASYEAWIGMTTVSAAIELTPEFFQTVEFYKGTDGRMYLEVSIDPRIMTEKVGEMAGISMLGHAITHLTYTYEFDANGAITSYKYDTGFYAGMGEDAAGNPVPVNIVIMAESTFSEVGTLSAVKSVPTHYHWIDASRLPCTNHTETVVPGLDPTCFGQGRTECSYCSVCFSTIQEVQILAPEHNYIGGTCADCGSKHEAE